jgi:hypothetical protein
MKERAFFKSEPPTKGLFTATRLCPSTWLHTPKNESREGSLPDSLVHTRESKKEVEVSQPAI